MLYSEASPYSLPSEPAPPPRHPLPVLLQAKLRILRAAPLYELPPGAAPSENPMVPRQVVLSPAARACLDALMLRDWRHRVSALEAAADPWLPPGPQPAFAEFAPEEDLFGTAHSQVELARAAEQTELGTVSQCA